MLGVESGSHSFGQSSPSSLFNSTTLTSTHSIGGLPLSRLPQHHPRQNLCTRSHPHWLLVRRWGSQHGLANLGVAATSQGVGLISSSVYHSNLHLIFVRPSITDQHVVAAEKSLLRTQTELAERKSILQQQQSSVSNNSKPDGSSLMNTLFTPSSHPSQSHPIPCRFSRTSIP